MAGGEMTLDTRHQRMLAELTALRGQRQAEANDALQNAGGGGTSGGMSDDWKESVDRQLGQLHGDVRALLGRGVVAVVALAGMLAGLYFYIDTKTGAIDDRLRAVEVRQVEINGKLDRLIERSNPPVQ